MISLKEKKSPIYKENPNGTAESLNNLIQYEVMYFDSRKEYVLNCEPCTLDNGTFKCVIDFSSHAVSIKRVSRRSAKAQRECEAFVSNNIEAIHTAYLNNGLSGVKEVIRDLFV